MFFLRLTEAEDTPRKTNKLQIMNQTTGEKMSNDQKSTYQSWAL